MSLKFNFSNAIYHKRTEMKYTQETVAEAVKISVRWYQKIEKGARMPGTSVFLRLVKLFKIDVNNLLDDVDVDYDCLPKS